MDELRLQRTDTSVSDHLPLVFDFRSARLPEFFSAEPIEVDGSTQSTWFGNFNAIDYPLIQHESLGTLSPIDPESPSWFLTDEGKPIWIDPQSYPWVYIPRP